MIANYSIPWILNTKKFNTSWFNQTNTLIKIIPSLGRDQDEGFNLTKLSFNWNVTSVTQNTI